MSASGSGCSLGAQCPEYLVRRHGLARIRLRQRTFESGLEPSPLFVTHGVIHRLIDALQERVGDLQPHRLVEREELLEELLRYGHGPSLPEPVAKVDEVDRDAHRCIARRSARLRLAILVEHGERARTRSRDAQVLADLLGPG